MGVQHKRIMIDHIVLPFTKYFFLFFIDKNIDNNKLVIQTKGIQINIKTTDAPEPPG